VYARTGLLSQPLSSAPVVMSARCRWVPRHECSIRSHAWGTGNGHAVMNGNPIGVVQGDHVLKLLEDVLEKIYREQEEEVDSGSDGAVHVQPEDRVSVTTPPRQENV
jgi:hypothetical protein